MNVDTNIQAIGYWLRNELIVYIMITATVIGFIAAVVAINIVLSSPFC